MSSDNGAIYDDDNDFVLKCLQGMNGVFLEKCVKCLTKLYI